MFINFEKLQDAGWDVEPQTKDGEIIGYTIDPAKSIDIDWKRVMKHFNTLNLSEYQIDRAIGDLITDLQSMQIMEIIKKG